MCGSFEGRESAGEGGGEAGRGMGREKVYCDKPGSLAGVVNMASLLSSFLFPPADDSASEVNGASGICVCFDSRSLS